MRISAFNFSKNRKHLSLTKLRINKILTCMISSYEKILSDGIIFNYADKGSIKEEDYLRNRLVDDYLENELNSIKNSTNNFTVNKEVSEEYRSSLDGLLHNDPIDIHIVDYALKNSWGQNTKPYFAIECKRLVNSVSNYVNDTKKATERDYSRLRLPFEGQLGFIENNSWKHDTVVRLINRNLESNSSIETTQKLVTFILKDNFDASYISKHRKKNKTLFSVYHLFFNYCKITCN
ncbi:hypothetical protein U8527_07295 [Kordia algicida OT-1]|uniref:Uncharacterized protein n=1 Tax=Kordia algicida OT-1 TaxID=391587 RepID=A9EA70_9FLAO|nr:hypothetical protein [Kordia algicida]EDP94750.1 hypothetical protein KAOT1_00700 [Kordia algicida OT-1]